MMVKTAVRFTTLIIYHLILSFIVTINGALAHIMTISDFTPLTKLLEECGRDTLVIFDVDHVLIMPTDEYTLNRHPYRKQLWQEIESRLSKEDMKVLYGLTASKAEWRLVDPGIIGIFTHLRKRQISSVALTSIYTGKFGNIEKLEDWRIKHLHDLGFDFGSLTPIQGEMLLHELEEQDGVPMLKSGVILTAQIDKGKVLERILRRSNYYPETIVFIDDMLNNLESLEKLSAKLKIQFYGFHYTAASHIPIPVIDKKIEKLRFQILEKEHQWLNYEELANRQLDID
jgi:hydroxymethylpyrimidine pyrophosphatase-like HAD family hydrolase